ncbi:hypothetical protein VKT23_004568 [Stygiomarasmius scandens]|uniref:Uncharacterized protein n=1 Tax=Marasmiellus scandens TaxID=2682957 RepID=A0ABR1JVD4_9AGAR
MVLPDKPGAEDVLPSLDKDKSVSDIEIQEKASIEFQDSDADLEFTKIPKLVRDTVSFDDDPTENTITFRVIVLTTLFVCLGAFVGQLAM